MKRLKMYLPWIVLFLGSLLSVFPLFHHGFFPMHDDTQVARVFEMGKMLGNGMLPVRWVPDLGYGYGYPIFNFYAPFAYYLGGFITLLGFDSLISTKLIILFAMLVSGVGMYLLAKEFWGEVGGIVSALLYVYAPYHALNLYVRGDVAEIFAYAAIPFLFYGLWKQYTSNSLKYLFITSLSYAAIILSHNLTALMVSPFFLCLVALLYILKRQKTKKYSVLFILLAPVLGILLASFYWLPVFFEMKYTNVLSQVGGLADFRNHFVCLPELWSSPWMYGGSIPGCVDGLSFRIGKLHIVFSILAMAISTLLYKKQRTQAYAVLLSSLGCLVSIFLLLPQSRFIWEAIPHMSFFQYPWRFLLMIAFFTSFSSGAVILFFKKIVPKNKNIPSIVAFGIVIVLLLTSIKIFVPQQYLNKSAKEYTNERALKAYASSLSDEYLPAKFAKPQKGSFVTSRFSLRSGSAQISDTQNTEKNISAHIVADAPSQIRVHLAYFPTWHVFINGAMSEFGVSNRGLVVTLPKGTYNIAVVYQQTPIEKLGDVLSLIGVGILIAVAIFLKKKRFT